MENISAVIELGTKGIRLLVAVTGGGKIQYVVKSVGDLSYLGKEADEDGKLSEGAIRRVTKIAKQYQEIATENGAESLSVVATDIVRRAPNKDELIDSMAEVAPLHVLSEKEEALCIFIASTAAFQSKLSNGRPILVVDQGGGSTELVLGRLQNGVYTIDDLAMIPIGTAVLAKTFLSYNYLSDGFKAVQKQVEESLDAVPILGNSAETPPQVAIAHGSAITVFVRGVFHDQYGYEPKLTELHGKTVKSTLIERKVQETIPGLEGVRKKDMGEELKSDSDIVTLLSGIPTYREIVRRYRLNGYVLSREGLRYGALLWKTGISHEFQLPK